MSGFNAAFILTGLACWAILLRYRHSPSSTGRARTGWLEATGVAVAAMLWWTYVKTTNPAIVTLSDLLRANVDAGGGLLPTPTYAAFLGLAFCIGFLFVCVGHFTCQKSGAFDLTLLSGRDIGLLYYIGMAAFLTTFASAATISGHAFGSYLFVMTAFVAITLYTVRSQRVVPRAVEWIRAHGATMLAVAPILVVVLCLLQYVVTKRGGPLYEEFARFVVANDRIPLINRHFGQSLLASGLMFIVGTGPDPITYPRATVNHWLYVSQVGFMFLVYRVLRELGVSRPGAVFGLIVMMLGNAAFSLLPHILYDHDYPVILNIYTDSLFGLAGFMILVWYLVSRARATPATVASQTPWWPPLIVPALITMAFTYTAELNMALSLAIVVLLLALKPFDRTTRLDIPGKELMAMLLVSMCAIVGGAMQGGIFASRVASPEQKENTPFFESRAASARMTPFDPRWWYLPAGSPGLTLAERQLPREWELSSTSINDPLLDKFLGDASGKKFRYIYLIHLAELRLFQTLRLVWFPLVGLVGLGVLVIAAPRFTSRPRVESDGELARLRLFWVLAAGSFVVGLLVVFFTNSVGGNAIFWKGALTRFFEPGLCLGMLAFAIAVDRCLRLAPSPARRYLVWTALAVVMSFGTVFRILVYQNLSG